MIEKWLWITFRSRQTVITWFTFSRRKTTPIVFKKCSSAFTNLTLIRIPRMVRLIHAQVHVTMWYSSRASSSTTSGHTLERDHLHAHNVNWALHRRATLTSTSKTFTTSNTESNALTARDHTKRSSIYSSIYGQPNRKHWKQWSLLRRRTRQTQQSIKLAKRKSILSISIWTKFLNGATRLNESINNKKYRFFHSKSWQIFFYKLFIFVGNDVALSH